MGKKFQSSWYCNLYFNINTWGKKNEPSIAFSMQASVTGASVRGLKGCKTLNKDPDPKNPLEGKEERFVPNSCEDMVLLL